MMRDDTRASLDAYIRFYETLTPQTVGELQSHVTPDVHFQDPFNGVQGVAAYERVLKKMFEDLDKPRFEVLHAVLDGSTGYLKWRLAFRGKRGRERTITGMSELHFDGHGRVASHVDYWDAAAQLYEHVPVLGFILRKIRQRLAA
jgi:predicted ester cyclase